MIKTVITIAGVVVALGSASERAHAGIVVHHVPPAGAQAATQLELAADAPATSPALTVHYRTQGTVAFATAELVRQGESRWVVVVPPAAVAAPGFEYFLAAGPEPVFATETLPHTLPVTVSEAVDRRTRDLARTFNRRSRIHTSGEWVDYGSRTVDGTKLLDRYYRIDADFAYRLWAYPLEELRVGYTRLIGDTPAPMCPTSDPCTEEAGFKVAGWFELGLAPIEGFRFDARLAVMATQDGFAVGGRGEARLGERDASHVAIGVELMADVGVAGYFRLGWGTVKDVPMAATVEITNLPSTSSATGVRLYYDVAHDVAQGVRIGLRVGYAARTQLVAGFTGGTNLTVDF